MQPVVARTLASISVAAMLAAAAVAAGPARADDGASEPRETRPAPTIAQLERNVPADPEPWRFSATAYGWLINVGGSVTARNQTVDVSASFIDLVQKSDSILAYMTYLEADKGPVGAYLDFVFAKLGFGAGQTSYRSPEAGLSISAKTNAALTYDLFIIELGGAYELKRWAGSEKSFTALDAVGGFRYWNNSTALSLDVAGNVNVASLGLDRSFGLAVARSDVVQWVDPVIGFRLRHQFTPSQHVFVRGDIGGFGLGGSQFSWQAVAAYSYGWQFTGYQIDAVLGFRALGVNYSSGSGIDRIGIDEVLYGPIIGATIRF